MGNRRGEMRGISDKDLVALINQKLRAQEICGKAGISPATLQRRIGEIMQKYQKFIRVPDLYENTGQIRFSGRGIVIECPFEAGDEFYIDVGNDCSINWTGNTITLSKIGPFPVQEKEIKKEAEDSVPPPKEKRAAPRPIETKTQDKKQEDLESLNALFEGL